jgi:dTDP-4-amino-4,6-dideoxygalactose transaminase
VELGYNYRIDDIRASLALVQFAKLEGDVRSRGILRARYEENLCDVEEIVVPFRDSTCVSSNYIFPIVLREGGAGRRESVRRRLAEQGIQTSVHYPPIHRFSMYQNAAVSLPQTDFVCDHEITLPLFGRMSLEQVDQVSNVLTTAVRKEVFA